MESKEPKAQSTIHGLFSNAYIKFSLVNCGKKKTLKKCGVFKKTATMDKRRHSDMTGDQKTCFVGNQRVIVCNSPEDQEGKPKSLLCGKRIGENGLLSQESEKV